MKRLLTRSLLLAALCACLAVPALAADFEPASSLDAGDVAAGADRDGGNRTTRGTQIGPDDDGMPGNRGVLRDDGNMRTRGDADIRNRNDGMMRMRNDGTVRTTNDGVYRTRATAGGTNWSWLGLLGLLGLAGLRRGDNRNRNRM